MLSNLKKLAKSALSQGESLFNRVKDKNVFKRMVCAAYLIADADGDFDADERKALVKLMKRDLPDFTTTDIIDVIKECEDKVAFDKVLGTQEILDTVAKASSEEEARQIMKVCEYIGASDGDYDRDEKLMAKAIATALKLNHTDYNL